MIEKLIKTFIPFNGVTEEFISLVSNPPKLKNSPPLYVGELQALKEIFAAHSLSKEVTFNNLVLMISLGSSVLGYLVFVDASYDNPFSLTFLSLLMVAFLFSTKQFLSILVQRLSNSPMEECIEFLLRLQVPDVQDDPLYPSLVRNVVALFKSKE